jgi:acyl dehydratase
VGNPRVVQGIEGLRAIIGEPLGPSPGRLVDQAAVNAFAEVTGDHQWIHLDVERARATPFGGTIIHGYFVLSLVPTLLFGELLRIEGVGTILNYGLDKLRFPGIAKVGSTISCKATLASLTPRSPGELAVFDLSFHADGAEKPSCVAQVLLLLLP